MKVFVIGAGQVGSTIVEALHDEHAVTVIDLDRMRLERLAYRYDVATVEGNGASRNALADAGVAEADLVIACTSRDETNLVAGTFARLEARRLTTVIRTTNIEYIELWRQGQLDVDFVVSSELETANAITRTIGIPSARQTDVFAEGQVQIVEFEVGAGAASNVVGRPLRDARIPDDSKVAGIVRGDAVMLPGGDATIEVGDRVVVIGSPRAAQAWSQELAPGGTTVEDVVVYGGGRIGVAIAGQLLAQKIAVRLIEPSRERAREIAEMLPQARIFNADGVDPDFFERERIGQAQAAIFAMGSDSENHYAATLAKVNGVGFTIAIVDDPTARAVYEHSGIDVTVNPRQVTAEEIVRFAYDPRTQQVAMLEGDRFEVLDIVTRAESEYIGKRFRDMPIRGALIGAIVRDGEAIFPKGDDVLQAGDRVILFTEASRVASVERAL
ncbi:MAG TPA: Trk system potassium transporter TrkA [Gaiellaceae bacterium]